MLAQLRSSKSLPLALALLGGVAALGLDLGLGRPGSSSDFVRFIGRFHPLLVHLPIGFLLLVAFAEGLSFSPRLRSRVDPALGLLWPALVLSALLAFGVGLLLAHDGGYPQRLVSWHRRLTLFAVLGVCASFGLWSRVEQGRAPRAAYRALFGLSLAVISIGAHFGGSLSRGEGYLFEFAPGFVRRWAGVAAPAAPPAASSAQPAAEPLVYRDVVAPILERRCVECHGAKKSKGGLRLDSFALLSKGGEHGTELVAGDSAHSKLVQRMLLPVKDDDHMPPEDKQQPSAAELELLRWWIDRGATDTLRVRDTLAPDAARGLLIHSVTAGADLKAPFTPGPEPAPAAVEPAKPASPAGDAAVVDARVTPGAGTGQLYADVIAPLLADRCARCHGAEKQKGKLRVDSLPALAKGGKGGAALAAGGGTLMDRVTLAVDDEHHMPPSDEPQLSKGQVALLAWWIKAGAGADVATSAAPAALVAAARAGRPKLAARQTPVPPASSTRDDRAEAGASQAPATNDAPARVALPARLDLYRDVAQPILASRCAGCHGGADPDGDLRVDDRPHMLASGAIVPFDTKKSELLVRMRVPPGKGGHMPPMRAAQPEAAEVAGIELWISRGAPMSESIESAALPDALASVVALGLAKRGSSAPGSAPAPQPPTAALARPVVAAGAGVPALPPQRAGCASCNVGAARSRPPLALAALALLLLAAWRRATCRARVSAS